MTLTHQVAELALLKCSLLPDEVLELIVSEHDQNEIWKRVLEDMVNGKSDSESASLVNCPAQFTIKINNVPQWFEVELSKNYPGTIDDIAINFRGLDLSRALQEHWRSVIQSRLTDVMTDSEYPVYEVLSTHLLPLLHEQATEAAKAQEQQQLEETAPKNKTQLPQSRRDEPIYHALLSSHHLKSPQKRRSMKQWSSELRLHGFAKVGHPGIIYSWGAKSDVEDFVSRVKDMQWLALRVRFVEELPNYSDRTSFDKGSWIELEKIGEVVEEMGKLGREHYVLDLGIGSAGGK